jgi:hypothetical protein
MEKRSRRRERTERRGKREKSLDSLVKEIQHAFPFFSPFCLIPQKGKEEKGSLPLYLLLERREPP